MDVLTVEPERLTFWYLFIMHLISICIIASISFYNVTALLFIPLLAYQQRKEWLRYYYLSHPYSVVQITKFKARELEIKQNNGVEFAMTLSTYFRLGDYMICYLQPSSKLSPIQDLQFRKMSYLNQNLVQLKRDFRQLNPLLGLCNRTIVISETTIGKERFRAILRGFIWGE